MSYSNQSRERFQRSKFKAEIDVSKGLRALRQKYERKADPWVAPFEDTIISEQLHKLHLKYTRSKLHQALTPMRNLYQRYAEHPISKYWLGTAEPGEPSYWEDIAKPIAGLAMLGYVGYQGYQGLANAYHTWKSYKNIGMQHVNPERVFRAYQNVQRGTASDIDKTIYETARGHMAQSAKMGVDLPIQQAQQAASQMAPQLLAHKGQALVPFKEPGIAKVFTPKDYYLRLLGAEKIVLPLTQAKEWLSIEQQKVNSFVDKAIRNINKLEKTSFIEKAVKKVLNKPTDAVTKWRDLMDTYEYSKDAPPGVFTKESAKQFDRLRSFTKSMLERTNVTRETLGLQPIKDIKAYVSHFTDALTQAIIDKKYPYPEDVKYWLNYKIPNNITNRTAFERKVKGDLDEMFSKDLGLMLKTMAKHDLREIYLQEPYTTVKAQIDELGDTIPATTKQEIMDYVRTDIMNYPTRADEMVNQTLKKPTQFINKGLAPLNRRVTDPIKTLSSLVRRLVIDATIWGRIKLPIRNMFQKLLLLDLYPVKHFAKASAHMVGKEATDLIRNSRFYKISSRYEDLPKSALPFLEHVGMIPYQASHLDNVSFAMKVGYSAAKDLQKKYGWTEEDVLKEMEEAASLTQWKYFTTGMPQMFRGQSARAMLSLQSWWMNYFFKHGREMLIRGFTGKTSWGKEIPFSWRFNALKGLGITWGLIEGMRKALGVDYRRFFMLGVLPAYLSPQGQILLGIYKSVVAKSKYEKRQAQRTLKQSWKAFVPGSLAWKDWQKFWNTGDVKKLISYEEYIPKEKSKLGKLKEKYKTKKRGSKRQDKLKKLREKYGGR